MPSLTSRVASFVRYIGQRIVGALPRFGIARTQPKALPASAPRRHVSPQERAAAALFKSGPGHIKDLPLWAQFQRIGGSLTPEDVSSILREADTGYIYRLMDLLNDCRQKDCHLQSVLATRELALAGLQWQVVPGGTRAKDKRAATWCDQALRNILCFPAFIAHLAGGNYYGHAVSEVLYKKDSGKLVPYDIKNILPRRFVYELTTGQFCHWDMLGDVPYPGVNLRKKYPGNFVEFHPRINGDAEVREGLGRLLIWPALFRNWDMRDWLSLGELAWKPWRIGTYTRAASDEDIEHLEAVLESLTTNGVATIPETTSLKIENAAGTSSSKGQHGELYSVLGSEMSKAVLGQTLTTEQGRVGSMALGTIHDKVRRDILEADAVAIAAVIRRDLLAWMVKYNFPDVAVPKFEFLTDEAVDLKAFAEALRSMRDAGMPIQVSWVRDRAGIPEPLPNEPMLGDEDEEEEGDETPEPPASGPSGNGGQDGDGKDEEPVTTEDTADQTPSAPKVEDDETPAPKKAA